MPYDTVHKFIDIVQDERNGHEEREDVASTGKNQGLLHC